MTTSPATKLAVLIDAENAKHEVVESFFAEIAKYGSISVKRAYGDWTGTGLDGWKTQLRSHSIQPIQQFAFTEGKNATDAMIIDAMDMLYTDRFDGFCILSSYSDFSYLATRIRESGLVVYGCGGCETPRSFVAACTRFFFVDDVPYGKRAVSPVSSQEDVETTPALDRNNTLQPCDTWLCEAMRLCSDHQGWANLAVVGSLVTKEHPNFDPRTYGFAKLSEMMEASTTFELMRHVPGPGKATVMYARERRNHRGVL